jgi:hypothetical protein
LAMATAIRQRAVKTSSGRATARGTGGPPALAPEGGSPTWRVQPNVWRSKAINMAAAL